jgi:hypothetical protein
MLVQAGKHPGKKAAPAWTFLGELNAATEILSGAIDVAKWHEGHLRSHIELEDAIEDALFERLNVDEADYRAIRRILLATANVVGKVDGRRSKS